MKSVNEMNISELKDEIKYLVSLMNDEDMAIHNAAYQADLTEEFAKRVNA